MKRLLSFLLFFVISSVFASETYTVPADIRADFKKNKCSEISDYYLESHVLEKPYIYGIKSLIDKTANDHTFIAWCRSAESAEAPYMLIGHLEGFVWPGGCQFPIRRLDFAGGLSITNKTIELSQFITNRQISVGKGKKSGPVIRSENDGLVYELFCHQGAWIRRIID